MAEAGDRGRGPAQVLQGRRGAVRDRPAGRDRHRARAARPERRRQDDRRADPDHAAAADRRQRAGRRASTWSATRPSCASQIGLAGQYAAVDENLTGFENLEMVGRLYHLGEARRRERAAELLERFELAEAGDRLVEDLLRRHAAPPRPRGGAGRPPAGAVPRRADHRPRPAQPDRPLGGDRGARRARARTVLLTTQYLDEADRLADRIAVIDHGTLIAEGTLRRAQGAGRRRADRGQARATASSAGRAIAALAELAAERAVGRGRHGARPGPRAPRARSPRRSAGSTPQGIGDRRHLGPPADPRRRLPHPHRQAAGARGRRRCRASRPASTRRRVVR